MKTQIAFLVCVVGVGVALASPQRRRPHNPQPVEPKPEEDPPSFISDGVGFQEAISAAKLAQATQNSGAGHVPGAGHIPGSASQGFQAPSDPPTFHQALDSTDFKPTFAAPDFQSRPSPSSSSSPSFQGFQSKPQKAQGFQAFTAFQPSGSRQGVAQSPAYTVGGGIQYSGLENHKSPEFDGTTYFGTSQPHTFGYSVTDAFYGNTHAHNEYSDGETTQGEYRVLLPDGRTQVVKYSADGETGFQAKVTYEGEAKPYVPPKVKPGHGGGGGGGGAQFKPRPPPPSFGHGGGIGGFGIGGGAGGGGGGGFRNDKAPIYTPSGGAFKQ